VMPLGGAGCGAQAPLDCICTDVFVTVSVTVFDSAGAPVTGLSPVITVQRTGAHIVPNAPGLPPGRYTVITDNDADAIALGGDAVRFAVASGARTATADFVIGVDGPCRCHISKLSGPLQVVLH
jgi:hypothetical protein